MKKELCLFMSLLFATTASQTQLAAQSIERSEIPVADTWQLSDIYATDAAWEKAKEKLKGQFDNVLHYKGKLTRSAKTLLACLEFNNNMSKEFANLHSYAQMSSDQDTRNSKYMAMQQEMGQLGTDYGTLASFITPELAQLDKATLDKFIAQEPGLKIYQFGLYDILRKKAHTLSQKEEKILAEAGMLTDGPSSIYSIFSNAELPYPQVTLSDGTTVRLDKSGYGKWRASTNRQDREAVFKAFFGAINNFQRTFGAELYAQVKTDIFTARTRHYDSALHSSLFPNNIPVDVYQSLVTNVNKNLDSFHRYLKIKKKMLDVDTLKYSDIYAPTVKGVDLKYSYDQAEKLILESLELMGKDYADVVRKAFKERWIDKYPSTGKRSGAYSNGGCYDVHPYILMNYNGQYEDVSTLTHELGHTLHSYYSNKSQPFATADYSIFVAEVASTFNEALLIDMMLKKITDKEVRLSLLMSHLDGIKGTVFRQTQFAEFELTAHETAERGEPLTGDLLSKIYGDIIKRYYGHDKGICHIDELYNIEWAYVPHFYYNFYVYQYATSFTASTALAEKVLAGEPGAKKRYIDFISAGGSDYPINILKKAGVDMTTADPFNKTMVAMNRVMDEIEAIINK